MALFSPANPDLKWEQTVSITFKMMPIIQEFYFGYSVISKLMLMQVVIPEYVGAADQPWGNIVLNVGPGAGTGTWF